MEHEPTSEEIEEQKVELENIQQLAEKGFFTKRVHNQAKEEGLEVKCGEIIYHGGGNS